MIFEDSFGTLGVDGNQSSDSKRNAIHQILNNLHFLQLNSVILFKNLLLQENDIVYSFFLEAHNQNFLGGGIVGRGNKMNLQLDS